MRVVAKGPAPHVHDVSHVWELQLGKSQGQHYPELIGKISQQSKILILKSSVFGDFQLLEVGKQLIVKNLYWVFNVY